MAARKRPADSPRRFAMSEEHRVKIANSNILNALLEHILGKRDMSPTQVTAGLGLLKKVLPDLQAMQLEGTGKDGSLTITIKKYGGQ